MNNVDCDFHSKEREHTRLSQRKEKNTERERKKEKEREREKPPKRISLESRKRHSLQFFSIFNSLLQFKTSHGFLFV